MPNPPNNNDLQRQRVRSFNQSLSLQNIVKNGSIANSSRDNILPAYTPTIPFSPTVTPTNTPTPSVTITQTITPSLTRTPTLTPTITITSSVSPTPTITPTITITSTINSIDGIPAWSTNSVQVNDPAGIWTEFGDIYEKNGQGEIGSWRPGAGDNGLYPPNFYPFNLNNTWGFYNSNSFVTLSHPTSSNPNFIPKNGWPGNITISFYS